MHPRGGRRVDAARGKRAQALLDFVRSAARYTRARSTRTSPTARVTNYWGGSSNATTHLLERMHYRGLLRVVRRDAGIRVYAVRRRVRRRRTRPSARRGSMRSSTSRSASTRRCRRPAWRRSSPAALRRPAVAERAQAGAAARARRLAHAKIDGVDWYWPAEEHPAAAATDASSSAGAIRPGRLGSPALRAALGLGLPLRGVHAGCEAQAGLLRAAPALARPRHRVGQRLDPEGRCQSQFGYVGRRPRDRQFTRALDEELERLRMFLSADLKVRTTSGPEGRATGQASTMAGSPPWPYLTKPTDHRLPRAMHPA